MALTERTLWLTVLKSMAGRYSAHSVSLVSLLVLARVFTPEQFGVVALVQVIFAFTLVITEAGLGPAIINLDTFRPRERDGVYTLTLAIGGIGAVVVYLLTPALAWFFGEPRVELVTPWLAAALPFAAASMMPIAHLHRDKRFLTVGAADAIAELCAMTGSLAAWFSGWLEPIAALSVRMPLRTFVRWLLLYRASISTEFGRPRPGVHIGAISSLLNFSTYQLGFNVVSFTSRNVDNILVGKILGAATLGIYEKAYQLMLYPLMLLTLAMNPAIQPVVRTAAGNPEHAAILHLRFARVLAYLGLAAGAIFVFGADLIIRTLLGDNWEAVAPVLRILGLAVPVQVVLSTSGGFFLAMGNSRMLFLSGVASAVVLISAISIGVTLGSLESIAWALVFAFHINFLHAYVLLHLRVFRVSPANFFVTMLGPASLVVALAFASHGIRVSN